MVSIEPMEPSVFVKTDEIFENAEVPSEIALPIWVELLALNFVVHTRVLNGVPLYKLNNVNPVVQKLIDFDNALCWQAYESHAQITESMHN